MAVADTECSRRTAGQHSPRHAGKSKPTDVVRVVLGFLASEWAPRYRDTLSYRASQIQSFSGFLLFGFLFF